MSHWEVIVIGAGPAGLTAAARAAERGRRTLLLEKNRRAGIKILVSGGTRCNLTHATDGRGIAAAFGPPGRFLHSALALLGPQQLIDLIEREGVPTKVEEGGKVFPRSDRAADVLAALLRRLGRGGAVLAVAEPVIAVERLERRFRIETPQRSLTAECAVLTTGGQSYPACGTTGDGYRWAAALGHTIVTPRTALVPVATHATWVRSLQGVTVPDVLVRVLPAHAPPLETGRVRPPQRRGSVLFTHFGLSGPAILDISREISAHGRPQDLVLRCDFLPAISAAQLKTAFLQSGSAAGRRQVGRILAQWLPQRLAETLVQLAGVPADCRFAECTREDRQRLLRTAKCTDVPVAGTLGFRKAEVTAGGVALEEVDSRTMQSKRVPGLFLAGELLDLDGPIGGYNFQAAFSTGRLAGEWV